MKLSDYPVPANNNGFGWHWPPDQYSDLRPLAETRALLQRMKSHNAKWVKLITSPGGNLGWERGATNTGACEMTFCEALDQDFGVAVRIFNDWKPPYLVPALEANLRHLCRLAGGKRFYVECANEIDAEAAGPITDSMARAIVLSICDFIDWCWANTNGQIIPVWPSFGYGGRGRNWFGLAHDLGRGDRLDRCAVAVHNYASANRLYEPWDPEYVAGTPVTPAEFEAMPWRWTDRTLEQVNAKRRDNAAKRALLRTDQDIMDAYAAGWFTFKWPLLQLDALGHHETPLMLTETGTRVGEEKEWEARIDPLLHMERTLAMIADIRAQPRIIMSGFWHLIGKMFAPIAYVWEDQAAISPIWNREYNATMPAGEYMQIVTPGQLPIVDELEAQPVLEGKGETPLPDPDPPPEPDPGGQTMIVPRDIDPNTTEFRLGSDGKVRACPVEIMPVEDVVQKLGIAGPKVGDVVARITKLRFLDEDQAGQMTIISVRVRNLAGEYVAARRVRFCWPRDKMPNFDGCAEGVTEPNKGAEFAMGGGNFDPAQVALGPYLVLLPDCPSEAALGLGLPGNRHVAYEAEITLCEYHVRDVVMPEVPPPPPTPPDWTEPPMAEWRVTMRESGWNAIGIQYNPGSAFYKYAASNGLHGPLSNEYDPADQLPEGKRPPAGLYVAQDWRGQFGDVTLWAVVGHYEQIFSVSLVG